MENQSNLDAKVNTIEKGEESTAVPKEIVKPPLFRFNVKIIAVLAVACIAVLFLVYGLRSRTASLNVSQEPVVPEATLSPSPTSDIVLPSNSPTNSVKPTPKASGKSPSPTPSVPILKPEVNISYPTENQSISMTEGQTLCVVETPVTHTQGLTKKQNLNHQGWTSYSALNTTCFNPQEGNNTIEFQYKNNLGIESLVYTRNFTFHRIANITLSVSGNMYGDTNCNATKDGGETYLTGTSTTTASLFKMPEYTLYAQTNTTGSYTISKSVSENESVTVNLSLVAPQGYKIRISGPSFDLSRSSPSATYDWPMIPNENIDQCPEP